MRKFKLSKVSKEHGNTTTLRIVFGAAGLLIMILVLALYTQTALTLETNDDISLSWVLYPSSLDAGESAPFELMISLSPVAVDLDEIEIEVQLPPGAVLIGMINGLGTNDSSNYDPLTSIVTVTLKNEKNAGNNRFMANSPFILQYNITLFENLTTADGTEVELIAESDDSTAKCKVTARADPGVLPSAAAVPASLANLPKGTAQTAPITFTYGADISTAATGREGVTKIEYKDVIHIPSGVKILPANINGGTDPDLTFQLDATNTYVEQIKLNYSKEAVSGTYLTTADVQKTITVTAADISGISAGGEVVTWAGSADYSVAVTSAGGKSAPSAPGAKSLIISIDQSVIPDNLNGSNTLTYQSTNTPKAIALGPLANLYDSKAEFKISGFGHLGGAYTNPLRDYKIKIDMDGTARANMSFESLYVGKYDNYTDSLGTPKNINVVFYNAVGNQIGNITVSQGTTINSTTAGIPSLANIASFELVFGEVAHGFKPKAGDEPLVKYAIKSGASNGALAGTSATLTYNNGKSGGEYVGIENNRSDSVTIFNRTYTNMENNKSAVNISKPGSTAFFVGDTIKYKIQTENRELVDVTNILITDYASKYILPSTFKLTRVAVVRIGYTDNGNADSYRINETSNPSTYFTTAVPSTLTSNSVNPDGASLGQRYEIGFTPVPSNLIQLAPGEKLIIEYEVKLNDNKNSYAAIDIDDSVVKIENEFWVSVTGVSTGTIPLRGKDKGNSIIYIYMDSPALGFEKNLAGPAIQGRNGTQSAPYNNGDAFTFKLTVTGPDPSSDKIKNPTIVDVLPAGLTFASPAVQSVAFNNSPIAPSGYTTAVDGQKLTVKTNNINNFQKTDTLTVTVNVAVDLSVLSTAGSNDLPFENKAYLLIPGFNGFVSGSAGATLESDGDNIDGDASTTVRLRVSENVYVANNLSASIEKTYTPSTRVDMGEPGKQHSYDIIIKNTGDSSWHMTAITDLIPKSEVYDGAALAVSTNGGVTWTDLPASGYVTSVSAANIFLLKFVDGNTVPNPKAYEMGKDYWLRLRLKTKVTNEYIISGFDSDTNTAAFFAEELITRIGAGTRVIDTGDWDGDPATIYRYQSDPQQVAYVGIIPNITKKAFVIDNAGNWVPYDPNTIPLDSSSTVGWEIKIQNSGGTLDMSNPVIVDVLPGQLSYISNSFQVSNATNGQTTASVNFAVSGGRITITDTGTFRAGYTDTLTVRFRTTIESGYLGGIQNTAYVFPADTILRVDTSDGCSAVPANTVTGYGAGAKNESVINVFGSSGLTFWKEASDGTDTRRGGYDSPLPVEAGSTVTYELVINNTGNRIFEDFVVIDKLPFIGDDFVASANKRDSEFGVKLIAGTVAVTKTSASGVKTNITSAATISYSGAETVDRSTDFAPALSAPAWSAISSADTKLIRIALANSVDLKQGETITVTFDVIVPEIALTNNKTAWNSFAFKTTLGSSEPIICEPAKVGITVADPSTGGIEIEKQLNIINGMPETRDFYFKVTGKDINTGVAVYFKDGIKITVPDSQNSAKIKLPDLPYGEYCVEEDISNLDGYYSYAVSPDTFTVVSPNTNSNPVLFTVVNTYNKIIVTFDENTTDPVTGPSPRSKPVITGAAYGTLATVSRTGYIFLGWYTDPTGGTLVTDATIVTATSDHILYARWQAVTPPVIPPVTPPPVVPPIIIPTEPTTTPQTTTMPTTTARTSEPATTPQTQTTTGAAIPSDPTAETQSQTEPVIREMTNTENELAETDDFVIPSEEPTTEIPPPAMAQPQTEPTNDEFDEADDGRIPLDWNQMTNGNGTPAENMIPATDDPSVKSNPGTGDNLIMILLFGTSLVISVSIAVIVRKKIKTKGRTQN